MKTQPKQTEIRNFGQRSFVNWTIGLVERIQKMTEQELLAVLDMSKEEQRVWLSKRMTIKPTKDGKTSKVSDWSLADLAFKMRVEMKDHRALHIIYRHLIKSGKISLLNCGCCHEPWWNWWVDLSQPIHWIIAALIAKGKKR